MAISLASIQHERALQPPRLTVYGPAKIGKSTFGASAPAPIFIQTEDGLDGLQGVNSFPLATSFGEVLEAIGALYEEKHEYRTVVLDSADWLERLIWQQVALDQQKANIEEIGYGKGYVLALDYWNQVFEGLNALRVERGMAIVVIAHHEIKRFDDPSTGGYDRYGIKLHKLASARLCEWSDVIGFASYEVMTKTEDLGFGNKKIRAVGGEKRVMRLQERPSFVAGNRYGLPESVPLLWDSFIEAFSQAVSPAAEEAQPEQEQPAGKKSRSKAATAEAA